MDAPVWEHVVWKPLPALKRWLDSYSAHFEALAQPVHRLQVPRAQVFLILGFGDDLQIRPVGCPSDIKTFQSFVVGIQANPLITEHWGVRHCLEIPLSPWVAHRLFQGAATEFAGEVVALEDLWGEDAKRLMAQIRELPSWPQRFALVEHMLAEKLTASICRVRPEVRWAWQQLQSQGGRLSIRQLAQEIGWSDRHFATCFREHIGVTPKAAARQIRFTQAHQRLSTAAAQSLSQIALICGYSDQSHLTREFHAFSGCSPRALQKSRFPHLPGIPADIVQS